MRNLLFEAVLRAAPQMENMGDDDQRPGLAIISNCLTPYTVHLHSQVAERIPELKLHTLVTHAPAEFDWAMDIPQSIHATHFGAPDDSPLGGFLRAPLWEWRKGGGMIRYLHENRVRAVICNGYRHISYQRIIRHCHRTGIPLFYRNDSNIRCERNMPRWKRFAKSLVYGCWMRQVRGVMSMGEYGDQFFLKYGANPQWLYRVPCMPDYDFFATVDKSRLDEFRQRYGVRSDRRYLLYSGRLVAKKRVDLLIDAFMAIAEVRPDWDLLVVGDGLLAPDLRRRVANPYQDRIIWTGFLDHADCALAYHAADVLVLPSDQEPWALVVQEAMAAGLTVIASDIVGAAHELVSDKSNGRIFHAGDVSQLKQAILDVTNSDAIDEYKVQSLSALAAWRDQNDPVLEIRRALMESGVLGRAPQRQAAVE